MEGRKVRDEGWNEGVEECEKVGNYPLYLSLSYFRVEE